jgi:hypothetical protein
MFEILKFIVETVGKSFSLKEFKEARNSRKLNEIGTELFLMYSHINDILVVGREIVRELKSGLSWLEHKYRAGESDRTLTTHVDFLLRQQSLNILKLVRSIKRLRHEFELISPDVYLRLVPLLEGKGNIVSGLIYEISSEKPYIVSIDAINLDDLLMTQSLDGGPRGRPEEVPIVFERLAIENISSIPVSSYEVIKRYLDSRRPGLILDQIESIARKLRDSIVHNFTVNDILLRVGDTRLALPDNYV